MNVLYVDHTSLVSGAQRALLDLVAGLPEPAVATVMCPPGPLMEIARGLGVRVVEFPGTSGSLRLGPLQTPRAATEILRSAAAVRRTAATVGADVVHANSIRAGLITGIARMAGGPPSVVHIHDALPPGRSAGLIRATIRRSADAIITISHYTTDNFAAGSELARVHMLSNPLDLAIFDPASLGKQDARARLGLPPSGGLVGLIAQITPWKGQDTAVRAMALLRERHPDARLLLVGEAKFVDKSTRYDNAGFERWLRKLTTALDLDTRVDFCGERQDVSVVMRALDVLIAPSWEEPFGRSIIEAMALGTAVVATNVGGPPEFVEHGVDGLVLPPHDPRAWAVAIDRLLNDEDLRNALGRRGREKVVQRFDREKYVSGVLQVYDEVAG